MTSIAVNTKQHIISTSLRALIIASSFWVISLSLTVFSGSMAAILACLSACYFVDARINAAPLNRLRLTSIFLCCLFTILLGVLLAYFLSSTALISQLLTPIRSFNSAEFIKWFALSLAITVFLRSLSHRTSFGSVLEIFFVATAFVITLSAHRNGMIHRPFLIGDFAITRGIDPATILMFMGAAAVLSLAALLMIENNQKRMPYHFSVLALLCFSLLFYVQLFGLPTPRLTDDLGLTGSGQNQSTAQENPFRDGQNSSDDKEAPVAVVVFRDDYEPVSGSYYFRESAYSQFNGTMLDFTTRVDMDQDLIGSFTNGRVETAELPAALDQRAAVRTTIGMLVAHRSPFGLDSPVAFENTANPNNLRFKRTYDAYSLVPEFDFNYLFGRETGSAQWSEEVLQEYLTLPDDPRYKILAESLISNLQPEYSDDDFAKAFTIKRYLDENGIYSLKNEHAYEADPAGSFLFGDLTGYCMHFSFAATHLFRSIGIPARVGIGYSVPAANRAGGSALLIQAIHGHAWPEIYFEDVGWVIVDPAPQQTLVDMTTDPQDGLQQLLGDMLRDDAAFQDFLESQQTSVINIELILNILYSMIVISLLTGYGVKLYRLWVPRRSSLQLQYRLTYRAALDQLSAVGVHRDFGESREEFAERASETAPSLIPLTKRHLAQALGKQSTDGSGTLEELGTEMNSLRRKVASEISKNVIGWRKILAALNPFSWLMTK